MAIRDEIIRLLLKTEGGDQILALDKQIRELGDTGTAAAAELTDLTDEIGRTRELESAIARYRELGQAYIGYARAIKDGQADVARLAQAQRESSAAVDGQRAELADARAELARLNDANEKFIGSEEERTRAIELGKLKIDALARSLKDAEKADRENTKAVDASKVALERAAQAQQKLLQPLGQLKSQLEDAGLSATKLGTATTELKARAESARSGVAALADAVQKVNAVSDAHATLGTKPFGDIEREIAKVTEAYKTLATQGGLSDQALAQANVRMLERIRDLKTQTNGWMDSLDRVKGSVALTAASLYGITRALGSASKASTEFGTSIARINTLLDDDSGIPKITEDVKALAAQFGGKAVSQAQAFYDVLSAGFEDAADASTILTTSNKLAIGGVTDLGTATIGLVSVLKAYGLAASNAERVSDAYFTAAKGGATSVEELAKSVGQVAPLAAKAEVPIETLTAAIAALTNGGVATSDAVTQVSSILTALIKPTKEAKEQAAALGLEFNLAAVRSKGLAAFLQEVAEKAGGNEEVLGTLFGRVEAIRGIFALTGEAANDLQKILGEMSGAAGATGRAFEKLKDTPAAAMDRYRASVDQVSIALGNTVTAFTPVLDAITSLINAFNELPGPIKTVTLSLVALAAVAVPLLRVFIALRPAIALLAAGMAGPLKSALSAAAGAASGLVATLRGLIALVPGGLLIKVALVGIAAAIAGGEQLGEAIAKLTPYMRDLEAANAEANLEMVRGLEVTRQVVAGLREYADVQVLTADGAARLGEAERAAYEERLQGLEKYLQAQVFYYNQQARIRDLTTEEAEKLELLKAKLAAAKAGHDALASGVQFAADAMDKKLTPAAAALVQTLGDIGADGKTAAASIKKLFEGLDIRDVGRVGDVALAIQAIGEKSERAGQAVREGLAAELKKLTGDELLRFQISSQAAFEAVGRSGEEAAVVLQTTLHTALDRLQVDAGRTGESFTAAGKDIIATFMAIVDNAQATAQQIDAAFRAALAGVKTKEEAEALGAALKAAGEQGRIGLEASERAGLALQRRLREISAMVNPLANEFAQLGITSQRELNAARDSAAEAFDAIVQGAKAGQVAQEDVRRAFLAYAETARASVADSNAAAKAQVEGQLRVRAAMLGLTDIFAATAAAGTQAGEQIAASFDAAANSAQRLGDAADTAASGLETISSAAQNTSIAIQNTSVGLGYMTEAAARALAEARGFAEINIVMGRYRDEIFATREELEQFTRSQQEAATAAANAADEIAKLTERLRDQRDAATLSAADLEKKRYQDELARIQDLESAAGTSARAQAAELRGLAEAEHRRRLAEIAAEARARRESEQGSESGSSSSSGGSGTQGGSIPEPAGRPKSAAEFRPVINFNFSGALTPQQMDALAREIEPRIREIVRRSR